MEINLTNTKELTNDHILKLRDSRVSFVIGLTDDELDRMATKIAWTRSIRKYNDLIEGENSSSIIFKSPIISIDDELDMRIASPLHLDCIYFRSDSDPMKDAFVKCTDILDFSDSTKSGLIKAAVIKSVAGSLEWRFTKDQRNRLLKYIRTLRDIIML